ncbi:MAG: diguanylate cyclase [Arcobacteraceae bacterium]|nr:diguanylate cyclase [Arcobacteraceae bacterium]
MLNTKREYSLKTTILGLFSFITVLLLSIVGVQLMLIDKNLSLENIDAKIKSIASNLHSTINSSEEMHFNTIKVLNNLEIEDKLRLFANVLESQKNLYAIYIGYENSGFYELINLDIDSSLRTNYKADQKDRWLLIQIDGNNLSKKSLFLYDEKLNLTKHYIEDNSYISTSRPWYKDAVSSNSAIKTPPYKFSHIDAFGISYAIKQNGSKDVICIDVLLEDYQNTYKEHIDRSSMEVFIFQGDGTVISTLSSNNNLLKEFLKQNNDILKFNKTQIIKIKNKEYITQVVKLNRSNRNEYIALFADYDKTIEPYNQQTFNLLAIFLLTSLLMIPIILYFSGVIVRPIKELAKDSINIQNRDYDSIKEVKSNIKEVSLLSESFINMSKSISDYQNFLEEKVKERTQELSLKNKELYRLSITDKLTNIYNREKLDSVLKDEMNKALRYNSVFSVILIDIDFFKKVNDTYGHQVGDDVLKETASLLLNNIRNTDVVGRWGGEEFLVICPNTDIKGAQNLAWKLNNIINKYSFTTYPPQLTISAGVASYIDGIGKFDEIISNADKALYQAKDEGRNKVVSYEV